jgi:hypothetical protein
MVNEWKWLYSNGGIITDGKSKVLEEKLAPLPLCPPQIP